MKKNDWRWQMANRITSIEKLRSYLPDLEWSSEQEAVAKRYPFSLTPYYFSLIQKASSTDPIFRMAIPNAAENFDNPALFEDPLGEELSEHRPVPGLIHRYPDRVVLLVNGLCPVYCRHCTRKRFVGIEVGAVKREQLAQWIQYLRENPEIKDVILSGGDPLTLSDSRLREILKAVRSVSSVEIIRIGTRIPVLMPMRITNSLRDLIREFHPVWVVTHFNHPREVTEESMSACKKLIEVGIPVNNQSVLLKGVNDHPDIIEKLCRLLVQNLIRPYYLHQADLIQGIEHLRTPISRGIEIMEALRGRLGGFAIPQYVLDLPQGGGKVPILPNYIISSSPERTILRNFEGRIVSYPEPIPDLEAPLREIGRKRGGVSDLLSGASKEPLVPK